MASKTEKSLEQFTHELFDVVTRIMHNSRGRILDDEIEISMPQAMLLYELRASECICMSELSQKLQITQGVATRMVDRLVEKGLVERRRSPDDRRVVLVNTSARGEEMSSNIEMNGLKRMKGVFRTISVKEREEFLRLLESIVQQIEQI